MKNSRHAKRFAQKRFAQCERARHLVMTYGWNATVYQILNPGMTLWFSQSVDGVVGYVPYRRIWVVAGAPVCDEARLSEVIEEFESAAARRGRRVCYFGAAGRIKTVLDENSAYSSVVLGAQPVWKPAEWAGIIDGISSLRAQLNRARNKGIEAKEWPAERVRNHPQLTRLLNEWLHTRGLPPLHFLVEPRTLAAPGDRRLWVAEKGGVPVAFLNMAPVPQRAGWLTEQFVRGWDAPNGTIELLMDTAIRTLANDGAHYVTMGLVPLSTQGAPPDCNPFWLHLLLMWVRAHGQRFYNFGGLEDFKAKFRPNNWEPIWAISHEEHFSPATLWAISGAFARQPPARLLLHGFIKAVRQEVEWLRH